jgi:hypothetical protein
LIDSNRYIGSIRRMASSHCFSSMASRTPGKVKETEPAGQ